jgi:uncharacterized protein (DUF1778 family)
MKTNKTEDIRIRVTPEEKKIILENATKNNMKVSDYIRQVSIHTKEIKTEITIK